MIWPVETQWASDIHFDFKNLSGKLKDKCTGESRVVGCEKSLESQEMQSGTFVYWILKLN